METPVPGPTHIVDHALTQAGRRGALATIDVDGGRTRTSTRATNRLKRRVPALSSTAGWTTSRTSTVSRTGPASARLPSTSAPRPTVARSASGPQRSRSPPDGRTLAVDRRGRSPQRLRYEWRLRERNHERGERHVPAHVRQAWVLHVRMYPPRHPQHQGPGGHLGITTPEPARFA